MTDLSLSLLFAGLLALVTLWQSWAWALLLPCLPGGMLLRHGLPRGRALLVGAGIVMVAMATNTGVIGATLQADPDFAAGIYDPGFLWLVLALCWLLHTTVAVLLLAAGIALAEYTQRTRTGRTSASPSTRTRRRRR